MKYPKDFIVRVKMEYPKNQYICKLLDSGDPFLGKFLKVFGEFSMTLEAIVESFEKGQQQKILNAAKMTLRRINLYHKWKRIAAMQ